MYHVVIFTLGNPANIGGVQISTKRLVDHLSDIGNRISLFSHFKTPKEKWSYPCKNNDIGYFFYTQRDTTKNRIEIRDAVLTLKPDIVIIINSSQTAGVVITALSDLGIPMILSERGAPQTLIHYNWACRAQRDIIHSMCDGSHLLMQSYKTYFPASIQTQAFIIPSAVPLPDQDNLIDVSNRKKNILWVGRMTFEKDVNLLIDAFSKIAADNEDWTLTLVGDGKMRSALEEQVNEYNLKNQIIFTGPLFDLPLDIQYKNSSVFALSSRSEGCPLALREAMGWEIPVIGYADCPGTNEVIKPGVNGLLVETAQDRVTPLAQAIQKLIDSPKLRMRYGKEARETAKEYQLDIVHRQWENMIESCINNKGAPKIKKLDSYGRILEKMAQKLMLDGRSRNFIATMHPQNYLLFLRRKYRKQYYHLYGLPIFDFKEFFMQNPEIKLNGADPLLAYLRQSNTNYQPTALAPEGDKIYTPKELLEYWRQGDFSKLDAKTKNSWSKTYNKDISYKVFSKPNIFQFIRFLRKKTVWDRSETWKL